MASVEFKLIVTMNDGQVHKFRTVMADATRAEREVGQSISAMFGDKGLQANSIAKIAWVAMRRLKLVDRSLPFTSDDWDANTFETLVESIELDEGVEPSAPLADSAAGSSPA